MKIISNYNLNSYQPATNKQTNRQTQPLSDKLTNPTFGVSYTKLAMLALGESCFAVPKYQERHDDGRTGVKGESINFTGTTIMKPLRLGKIPLKKAMPEIEKYAKNSILTVDNLKTLLDNTYILKNSQGKNVILFGFKNNILDSEVHYTYDQNGNFTKRTLYDANGEIRKTIDYIYENGKLVTKIIKDNDKHVDNMVRVIKLNSKGMVISDTICKKEEALLSDNEKRSKQQVYPNNLYPPRDKSSLGNVSRYKQRRLDLAEARRLHRRR